MKKRYLIILLAIIFLPCSVLATGSFSFSASNYMYIGDSQYINVCSNNAVGKLNVSVYGALSTDTNSIFIQNPGSCVGFNVYANSTGSGAITVTASDNFASMDEEVLTGMSQTVYVTVGERPVYTPVVDNRSTNNNLKELKVDGYELEKVDDNNYKLSVSNDVTSITINATAEDTTATITGNGPHDLIVGENTIEIITTAENGSQNTIKIVVTRKDAYYLDDLDKVLKDDTKDINIKITADTKLTKEYLENIKNSGKTVKFNYFDDNNILRYSWSINGENIKESTEFALGITNTSDNAKTMAKLMNYAAGINLNFAHNGNLPTGTKVKYFVGDVYNDNDSLYLYYFNKEKNQIETTAEGLIVKDGYVEFEIEHCSDYFLSMSKTEVEEVKKTSTGIYIIVIVVLSVLLAGSITCDVLHKNPMDLLKRKK